MNALTAKVKRILPPPVRALLSRERRLLWSGWGSLGHAVARFRRVDVRTKIPPPPRSLQTFIGGSEYRDFQVIGESFRAYFINLARLEPDHTVLDVGCGVGRMAVALTSFLSPKGEYWGFDVSRRAIDWCRREISSRFHNFHFQWSDVFNSAYNPRGRQAARSYAFPFPDSTFDFVCLTSVFTHMLPADLERYLSEVARVLKPGGRCLATFFLLNDESKALIAAGASTQPFEDELPGCRVYARNVPEAAVAYEEQDVRRLYERVGLQADLLIYSGGWCGRASFVDYQDMIVAGRN